MATTDSKPGFRLPWSPDTNPVHDDAPGREDSASDAADPGLDAEAAGGSADLAMVDEPAIDTSPDGTTEETVTPLPEPRRPTRFMEELTKAMRVAAENAREETLERFRVDAKSAIESIHARSATDADDLRRAAEADIAVIRATLQDEITRIRADADRQIADREAGLEGAIEGQAARIEARLERVQLRVATFESEMTAFFDRILSEDDPAQFAAYAQNLPDSPNLEADLDAAELHATHTGADAAHATVADPWAGTTFSGSQDGPSTDPRLASLGLSYATAAEAEANAQVEAAAETEAQEDGAENTPATSGDLEPLAPDEAVSENDELVTTSATVVGLVSVASIASFKRALGQLTGVRTVGVSSGPSGEFVFAVLHEAAVDLLTAIPLLPAFGARVTSTEDGVIEITARDPETTS